MNTQKNGTRAAGDLDLSFGKQGKVVLEFGKTAFATANQVIGMPDDKLLIVGDSGDNYALGKMTKDGIVDTTFGNNGSITGVFKEGQKQKVEPLACRLTERLCWSVYIMRASTGIPPLLALRRTEHLIRPLALTEHSFSICPQRQARTYLHERKAQWLLSLTSHVFCPMGKF